jgi:hypothetical protein
MAMRDSTKKYGVWMFAILVMGALGFAALQSQEGLGGGQTYFIGDDICSTGEPTSSPDCGGGAPTGPQYTGQQIVCYTPDNIAHSVYVDDTLDEDGTTYLAATVKLYLDQTGTGPVEIDSATSSTSAATSMNVPCDKSALTGFMVATDDDNSGTDIYPAQKYLSPFTEGAGNVLEGPAKVPFHIPAMIQGTSSLTCYDNTGNQADNNITMTAGSTTNDAYIKLSETTDDRAFQGVMLLFDVNKSAFDLSKFELSGVTAGIGAVQTGCPTSMDNGTASWDKCYRLTNNGVALTLDRDTTSGNPDEIYVKASITALSTPNPTNDRIQVRMVDTMAFQAPGNTFAWYNDCGPNHMTGLCWAAENLALTNLGIQAGATGEAHHNWIIN